MMLRIVPCTDDRVFVISFNRSDGRVVAMQLNGRSLEQVGQTGSPYVGPLCLDAALFFSLAVLIPTFLLGLFARLIQYHWPAAPYQFGNEIVGLASIVSRGLARLMDLSIVGGLFLGSVVSHPEFVSWWACVVSVDLLGKPLQTWTQMLSWNWCSERFVLLQSTASALYAVPFETRIFILAVVAYVAQIVWQGLTGYSLGKWIIGIRVLRTTLRPCGIARSTLRELALLADSVIFWCWIPGVFSILTTLRGQRIGDRMADTIVVHCTKPICDTSVSPSCVTES